VNNVVISDNAKKDLRKLDNTSTKRILLKIDDFSKNPSQFEIKKLKSTDDLFRIRVGNFRIIFEYLDKDIVILKIGHRKDIYK
jgi:mRNA interferase RelE/StbE